MNLIKKKLIYLFLKQLIINLCYNQNFHKKYINIKKNIIVLCFIKIFEAVYFGFQTP